MNNKTNKILILIILLLVLTNGYTIYKYYGVFQSLETAKGLLDNRVINSNVLNFTKLVLDKVLGAQKEVSLEDRLQLENSVRALQNPIILEQWNAFIQSQTQSEAQDGLRKLLINLINQIKP